MAQTTRLASFGPVLVISARPSPLRREFCSLEYIYIYKTFISMKNYARIKKRRTNGPNDARRVVWARLARRRPFQPSPWFQNIDRT